MASSTLRAAHAMRVLLSNGSRAFTSRTLSTSIIIQSNTVDRNPLMQPNLLKSNLNPSARSSISFQQMRYNTTTQTAMQPEQSMSRDSSGGGTQQTRMANAPDIRTLDRTIALFEERCQRHERVLERDYVRTFNLFTRVVDQIYRRGDVDPDIMSNIIQYSSLLLRCCGRLMYETPPKGRELLAGNLWAYIKERKISLDISHFNSLIRVLNENETVYDPQKIIEEIKQNNLIPDRVTYQRLIHQYCLQGDIAGATKLLEIMKNDNMELNETIFASLIIGYGKQENPPAIAEMFDLMRQNGVEPGSRSCISALVSLADRFAKNSESATAELASIIQIMEKDEIQFSTTEHIDLITHLGPLRESQPVVAQFLDKNVTGLYGSGSTRYRILAILIQANQIDMASNLFWSQHVAEKALQSGNLGAYYVRALAKHFNVPTDFAIGECLKIKERHWNPRALHILYFTAAEVGNLKLVREAIKVMTREEPMKVIYTWPLLAQAKDQSEVIKVLKEDLNPKLDTNELMETFSFWVWPKFADNVLDLFKFNKQEALDYDGNMLMASFLNYCVQDNKIEEAIKFISEVPQDLVEEAGHQSEAVEEDGNELEPTIMPRRVVERGSLIGRLLNHIAEQTKDPALVRKAFNMCQLPNQQLSTVSLNALVRVHLLNDDFNSALEEFLKISKEYRATPGRNELMTHCLVNKDPESLQKIMNAVSEIYGEPNSLFDLAVCCLWCNKLKQAQKIFASPGFRVRPIRVYQACRTIARQDNIHVLENFVNLTRDMYDINQEYLYQVLIETYERTSNAERVLNLWNMMQEEEFQPSKKSLVMIANLLEKNNIPVPFQKPKTNYLDRDNRPQRSGSESRNRL